MNWLYQSIIHVAVFNYEFFNLIGDLIIGYEYKPIEIRHFRTNSISDHSNLEYNEQCHFVQSVL